MGIGMDSEGVPRDSSIKLSRHERENIFLALFVEIPTKAGRLSTIAMGKAKKLAKTCLTKC